VSALLTLTPRLVVLRDPGYACDECRRRFPSDELIGWKQDGGNRPLCSECWTRRIQDDTEDAHLVCCDGCGFTVTDEACSIDPVEPAILCAACRAEVLRNAA
jgi:hypothetical protein